MMSRTSREVAMMGDLMGLVNGDEEFECDELVSKSLKKLRGMMDKD
jgi:hypothetical protein